MKYSEGLCVAILLTSSLHLFAQNKVKVNNVNKPNIDYILANLPTLCALTEISSLQNIDGISILPILIHQSGKQKKHPFLYWEFPGYQGQQGIRIGKWKGIRFNMNKGNLKIKLFDLDNDIQEQHDIADQHPQICDLWQHKTTANAKGFKRKSVES